MLEAIRRSGYFQFLCANPPATEEEIIEFVEHFGHGYEEYLELMREATDIEFSTQSGNYARITTPTCCISDYAVYDLANKVEDAVPIGDDGSGGCIYYGTGTAGRGIYLMDYGNLCQEDSVFLAGSLREFLIEGKGADLLR